MDLEEYKKRINSTEGWVKQGVKEAI